MTLLDIIEQFRAEPWKPFSPVCNCIGKSFRFRHRCHQYGFASKVVIALVAMDNNKFRFMPRILVGFHAWAEVDGERIELARPLDQRNTWGEYDLDIREIIAVRF